MGSLLSVKWPLLPNDVRLKIVTRLVGNEVVCKKKKENKRGQAEMSRIW